jgi:hypothetical protein
VILSPKLRADRDRRGLAAAQLGMTMIVGIVTEVAIFYYSELEDLPEQ